MQPKGRMERMAEISPSLFQHTDYLKSTPIVVVLAMYNVQLLEANKMKSVSTCFQFTKSTFSSEFTRIS